MGLLRLAPRLLSTSMLVLAVASPVTPQPIPALSAAQTTRLARYGHWKAQDGFGRVWFPDARPPWQPYSHGSWRRLAPSGWTWRGSDPWSTPTEHAGRWARANGSWFWIPGPPIDPEPVAWAIAPDYVGWCALGPDDGPAARLKIGSASPGWTMMRRQDFDQGTSSVTLPPVETAALSRSVPFIVQRVPPAAQAAFLTVAGPERAMPAAASEEADEVAAAPPVVATPEPDVAEPEPESSYLWGGSVSPGRHHRRRARDPYAPDFAPRYEPRFEPRTGSGADGSGRPQRRERGPRAREVSGQGGRPRQPERLSVRPAAGGVWRRPGPPKAPSSSRYTRGQP